MANFNDLLNTPDYTEQMDPADVQSKRGITFLAYFSILALIPLFAAKDSKFARFHCNQGIVLAIIEFASGVIFKFLRRLPLIGWIFGLVGSLIGIVILALGIIGLLNVYNGRAKEVPLVGSIKLINWQ